MAAMPQTTSVHAIELVNSIISRAIQDGASDIHFEPQANELLVRARIDGVMRRMTEVPASMQAGVTGRLKVLGELDIADKRAAQDGRVSIRYGGEPMDLRWPSCRPRTASRSSSESSPATPA